MHYIGLCSALVATLRDSDRTGNLVVEKHNVRLGDSGILDENKQSGSGCREVALDAEQSKAAMQALAQAVCLSLFHHPKST